MNLGFVFEQKSSLQERGLEKKPQEDDLFWKQKFCARQPTRYRTCRGVGRGGNGKRGNGSSQHFSALSWPFRIRNLILQICFATVCRLAFSMCRNGDALH